jgi:hypothetical protein
VDWCEKLAPNVAMMIRKLKEKEMYRHLMWAVTLLMMITLTPSGADLAQAIPHTPNDPDYCYKVEKIDPNLVLDKSAHLVGKIEDPTTAPVENSRVELRRYISQRKQISLRVVSTDRVGYFDLGIVKAGKYRLLASPNRGFKQPTALACQKGTNCELKITLILSWTDQLDSSCPIR